MEMDKYQEQYKKLQAEIELVEKRLGVYLTDECIDRENILPITENNPIFWQRMVGALNNSVGSRMDEIGLIPSQYGVEY